MWIYRNPKRRKRKDPKSFKSDFKIKAVIYGNTDFYDVYLYLS